jgi:hypothetical protein
MYCGTLFPPKRQRCCFSVFLLLHEKKVIHTKYSTSLRRRLGRLIPHPIDKTPLKPLMSPTIHCHNNQPITETLGPPPLTMTIIDADATAAPAHGETTFEKNNKDFVLPRVDNERCISPSSGSSPKDIQTLSTPASSLETHTGRQTSMLSSETDKYETVGNLLPPHFAYQLDAETFQAWHTMITSSSVIEPDEDVAQKKATTAAADSVPTLACSVSSATPSDEQAEPKSLVEVRKYQNVADENCNKTGYHSEPTNNSSSWIWPSPPVRMTYPLVSAPRIVPTDRDAIFGKASKFFKHSFYRSLIRKHWEAFSKLPRSGSNKRVFIQEHIVHVIAEHGGRFLLTADHPDRDLLWVQLFLENDHHRTKIYSKIWESLNSCIAYQRKRRMADVSSLVREEDKADIEPH